MTRARAAPTAPPDAAWARPVIRQATGQAARLAVPLSGRDWTRPSAVVEAIAARQSLHDRVGELITEADRILDTQPNA